MAILEVLTFPNPKLRRKAPAVTKVTADLKKLASDMLETMYSQKGIGLAATQVGELVRLLCIDTRPRELNDEDKARYDVKKEMTELEQKVSQPVIIYNPVIIKKEGKTTFEEGCLSVPGYYETVQRSNHIEVEGLDADGKKLHLELDGLLAICMQHEIDHLDGKLFIDRLSPIKSNRIKSKIKKFGYPKPGENKDDGEDHSEEKSI